MTSKSRCLPLQNIKSAPMAKVKAIPVPIATFSPADSSFRPFWDNSIVSVLSISALNDTG